MRLITSITALTIGAMIGSGSAAAIDTALVAREFPSWPNFHVPDGLVKVASGTISGVNGAIRNGVNTIQNVTNGAVQNVNNVIHDPGSVVLAALTPNKQNCPLIIQKTDWQKYLGVAPVVAAINKPCDWTAIMQDIWDGIKCGGNCMLALTEGDLNVWQDKKCLVCLGKIALETLPCINAAGGFSGVCSKAVSIPTVGACLTGTADSPGLCPKSKSPATARK